MFGFEVYAAIDAFSRCIIWVYVGISANTGVSCLRQFLDTVKDIQKLPMMIRSDHGAETIMLAAAHHTLRKAEHPEIEFKDCFLYGPSTSNQRIEAWWNQLTTLLTHRWRVRLNRFL